MTSFLIIVLTMAVLLALAAVLVLAGFAANDAQKAQVEMEIRRAERRLHDIARETFEAMLHEARSHDTTEVN